jgi:hypothetical protein
LFVCTGIYRFLQARFTGWLQLLVPAAAVFIILGIHSFLAHRPAFEAQWAATPFYRRTGFDQLQPFGHHFYLPVKAIRWFVIICICVELVRHGITAACMGGRRILLELYVLSFLAASLLPENFLPRPNVGEVGLLVSRFTVINAIFGLCWLGTLVPRRWHLAGFGACAALFFVSLYRDTAFLNRVQVNAENITQELPYGTRALATIYAPPDYRVRFLHVADRACVAHCFLYSNYEPSTREFRVRVKEGSPVVTSSNRDAGQMENGMYQVKSTDLPLKQIYQCDSADLARLCIRDLTVGEVNGRVGYKPESR